MKKITVTILLLAVYMYSFSQTETFKIEDSGIIPAHNTDSAGIITITQDVKLLQIIKMHKNINNNKSKGWRVQIYFGSGQKAITEAKNAKKRFLIKYGNKHDAYIIFESPYYRVRVGDFRHTSRAEALYFLDKIKATFPNSWLVEDQVNYPLEVNE